MTEIWKKIPGQSNYEVSSFGNIKNVRKNKILKPIVNSRGYCMVYLSSKGNTKRKCLSLHRLIFTVFNGKILNKNHIDHIDGDKLNNNLNNLRSCTPSENFRNSKRKNLTTYKGVHKSKNNKYYSIICLPVRNIAKESAKDYDLALTILSKYNKFKSLTFNRLNFEE